MKKILLITLVMVCLHTVSVAQLGRSIRRHIENKAAATAENKIDEAIDNTIHGKKTNNSPQEPNPAPAPKNTSSGTGPGITRPASSGSSTGKKTGTASGPCNSITIQTPYQQTILLEYDNNDKLVALSGGDEDGPQHLLLTVVNGLSLPQAGQKEARYTPNGDGNYIITMAEDPGDEEVTNTYKISKEGKIINWEMAGGDQIKVTTYTYNSNGDLTRMVWDGNHTDTKVTDHGELTATYNTSKPDAVMKGSPMKAFAEAWTIFPMTNNHQLTGFTYTQTIHTPADKREIKRDYSVDKINGTPVYKEIPAKDIRTTVSRNFSYSYDSKGRVSSITVTGSGAGVLPSKPLVFNISYGACASAE
ncbi:MAG: hypothetical protein U0U70_14385 [Chitinophagaceae bacterium]